MSGIVDSGREGGLGNIDANDPKQTPRMSEPPLLVSLHSCDPAPVPLQWELRDFRRGGNVRPDYRCHSQWRQALMVVAPRGALPFALCRPRAPRATRVHPEATTRSELSLLTCQQK